MEGLPDAFRIETLRHLLKGTEGLSGAKVSEVLEVKGRIKEGLEGLSEEGNILEISQALAKELREVLAGTPDHVQDFLMAIVLADLVQSRSIVATGVTQTLEAPAKRSYKKRGPREVKPVEFTELMSVCLNNVLAALGLAEGASYSEIIGAAKEKGVSEVAFLFIVGLMNPASDEMTLASFETYSSGAVVEIFRNALMFKFKDQKSPKKNSAAGALQANFSRAKGGFLKGNYQQSAINNLNNAWALLHG